MTQEERYQYARALLLAMSELEDGAVGAEVDVALTTAAHPSARTVAQLIDAHQWMRSAADGGFPDVVARAVQHHALLACPGLRRTT